MYPMQAFKESFFESKLFKKTVQPQSNSTPLKEKKNPSTSCPTAEGQALTLRSDYYKTYVAKQKAESVLADSLKTLPPKQKLAVTQCFQVARRKSTKEMK